MTAPLAATVSTHHRRVLIVELYGAEIKRLCYQEGVAAARSGVVPGQPLERRCAKVSAHCGTTGAAIQKALTSSERCRSARYFGALRSSAGEKNDGKRIDTGGSRAGDVVSGRHGARAADGRGGPRRVVVGGGLATVHATRRYVAADCAHPGRPGLPPRPGLAHPFYRSAA